MPIGDVLAINRGQGLGYQGQSFVKKIKLMNQKFIILDNKLFKQKIILKFDKLIKKNKDFLNNKVSINNPLINNVFALYKQAE